MSDEIKEILREAKEYRYIDLNTEKTDLFLDYITNLQQENKRLKEKNILLEASEPMSKIAEDYGYKSRCEKGIAICDEMLEVLYDYTDRKVFEDIKDALTGGDEE